MKFKSLIIGFVIVAIVYGILGASTGVGTASTAARAAEMQKEQARQIDELFKDETSKK